MAETDTDAADEFDASISRAEASDAHPPGLFRRYGRLPRNVLVISLVSFLNDASSEIIYPLLPVFLSVALGASPAVVGLIEGGAESVSSFLKLFAGYFSDRSGRRKAPVVFGYALASIVRPLLGFATSWPQLFAVRFADRVGKGIRSAPRDAMIADSAAPTERGLAFGFHRAMDHFGAVVGPLLGFALLVLIAANRNSPTLAEYKLIFLAASVPALAAVLVAAFALRETRKERDDGRESRKAEAVRADALRAERRDAAHAAPVVPPAVNGVAPPRFSLRGFDGNFKRFLVILALFTLSNSSDAFLLLRAREVGISTATIPLLWAALHAIKVLSSLVGGDLSDRLGRKTLIVSGWLFYAGVYLGFAFVSTVGGAWVLFLTYGIYFGLVEGAEKALVADLVPADKRGTAYGLYNLAFSITVWPASLLMGALWSWRGASVAFIASACIGTLAALLLALTIRPAAVAPESSPAR
ncbi:MAG TPA: MFS transporter [Pyrinomonadaceae bacterium]|jgi:MFS family permease|nr:MFS transporter [Pyrinomonadaceae bacterium]